MTEGAEILVAPQTKEAPKQNRDVFREADYQELNLLSHSIGEKALGMIQEKNIRINCVALDYPAAKFTFEVDNKVIEVQVYESPDKPAVEISFKDLKYLHENTSKKISSDEELKPYLETEKTGLTKETLGFLKLTGDFVLAINPDCTVYIQPSSQRREQIFTRFLKVKEHPNICVLPAVKNDIKSKMLS